MSSLRESTEEDQPNVAIQVGQGESHPTAIISTWHSGSCTH